MIFQVRVHQEELTFFLNATPRHPIVLGLSWLETHNPTVDWCNCSITFPVRPIPARPRHSLDSVILESKLVATLTVVSGDFTIPISNLPVRYIDVSDFFKHWNADRLPAHRPYNCPIELQDGEHPPFGPVYGLSEQELEALCTYLAENLVKGFIQLSQSPTGTPILFVKKKDDSLCLCVVYRGLNKVMIRSRYALPLIPALFDRLCSEIEKATNLHKVLEERILDSRIELTLMEVLGIARREFHDSIVDLVKSKRLTTEPEPEKPAEVRAAFLDEMAVEDELAVSHYAQPH